MHAGMYIFMQIRGIQLNLPHHRKSFKLTVVDLK